MMCRKRQQNLVHQNDVLEVVYDTLPVQKVHGGGEKVPIQRLSELELLLF
jgi:hypothetical protein